MGNVFAFARDSLTSLVSRMGTDRDKASTVFYTQPILTDDQIVAAYRGSWLPRKIVDIPALDACRKWRDWQAQKSQIATIEAEEKRLNVKGKILEAMKKGRLFGGAALLIGTGDLDPSAPLDTARVAKGGLKYITVMTRRTMTAGEIDRDPSSEFYGKPKSYQVTGANGNTLMIHPSRLVIFNGNMAPDDGLDFYVNQGWGESLLVSTLDAIKNADSTAGNIASLVFEAKIDIIRIPDFMASLNNEVYRSKIIERYSLANMSKGINGTLLLDKEEEYESKSATLAGLTDILMAFMQIVSGAADIPVTRLLGQSPAGMNATGASDMKNYHDRIQSMQELEMSPAMARLDECIIRSAEGVRDPSIYYRWSPLEQMSESDRATIFKTTADAARQLVGTATGQEIIPREAVSDALVNRLVEDGVLPGLDAAMLEYGKLSEQEPSDDEIAAAASAQAAKQPQLKLVRAANDASPRTLYVSRKVLNAGDLISWAKGQGFTSTLPSDELHVTVIYSKTPVDWMKASQDGWNDDGTLDIPPGGPRVVSKFDGGAVVLEFSSAALSWRHEELKRIGAQTSYPDYSPHITITYDPGDVDIDKIQPYQGKIEFGPELFAEVNSESKAGLV